MEDAREIYQSLLDRLDRAMWSGDDQAVLDNLALPNRMGTRDHMTTFNTRQELLETVQSFRKGLVNMGVRDFHRICNQAGYDATDPGRITGNHTTHVLSGGSYVLDPFLNEMTLIRRNGRWIGAQNRALVDANHYAVNNVAHVQPRDRTNISKESENG